jgi:hypothetical protein
MTPEQMKELADRLKCLSSDLYFTNAPRGHDLMNAADLIRQMAESEPVAWRWLYDGKPDGEKCFPMPGPDADVIARAASAELPRTVQFLFAAPPAPQPDALSRYRANSDGCEPDTPKERLRAFCSVAMAGQDWLDAESFFDALPDDTALLRQARLPEGEKK